MLTLCYAPSYGIEICAARRLTPEEKKHYAAWFAETGFIGVGSHVDLPCISHEDLPNRPDDGTFWAVIIRRGLLQRRRLHHTRN